MASSYVSFKDKLIGAFLPVSLVHAFAFTTFLILKLNLSLHNLHACWKDLVKLWYNTKPPTIFLI